MPARVFVVCFIPEWDGGSAGSKKSPLWPFTKKACLLVCFFLWCAHSGKIDPQLSPLLLFLLGKKKHVSEKRTINKQHFLCWLTVVKGGILFSLLHTNIRQDGGNIKAKCLWVDRLQKNIYFTLQEICLGRKERTKGTLFRTYIKSVICCSKVT